MSSKRLFTEVDLCILISSISDQVKFFIMLTFPIHGSNLPRSAIKLEETGFSDSCDAEDPHFIFDGMECYLHCLKPCKRQWKKKKWYTREKKKPTTLKVV